MNRTKVRRALLSVSDKTGLLDFAAKLVAEGVELIASGGTAAAMRAGGLPVSSVEQVTGAPEMLDGRVKTLHPRIHAAILADVGSSDHRDQLYKNNLAPIQLVVVNLYPFEEGVARPETTTDEAVELIDIGGPTMVRAAAKNHKWVGVVTSPEQYAAVARAVADGGLDDKLRLDLARQAFYRTARYDAAIVGWLESLAGEVPERMMFALDRVAELRYGENPHQTAALYAERGKRGWWTEARQLQGKDMSFNNYLDAEAAWRLANDFAEPTAVIVKHANPCGVASRDTMHDAFFAAWECDPLSAFGGVIALNGMIDEPTARLIVENFVEVVVALSVSDGATEILARKKNLRVLLAPAPHGDDLDMRRIESGFVAQRRDQVAKVQPGKLPDAWESVGERPMSTDLMIDLRFAWIVAAHTKSNAIVIAENIAAHRERGAAVSPVHHAVLGVGPEHRDRIPQLNDPGNGRKNIQNDFFIIHDIGLDSNGKALCNRSGCRFEYGFWHG